MKKPSKELVLSVLLALAIIIAVVAGFKAIVAGEYIKAQQTTWATWDADKTAYDELLLAKRAENWNLKEENKALSQTISEQEEKINSMRFVPLDVDIPLDDQALTFAYSTMYDIPYKMPLFVGLNETGWKWLEDVPDTNGLLSTGYLMLNEPTWDYLASKGIDVHTKGGNIHGWMVLASEQIERADSYEQALVFIECGYAGAQGKTSTKFSRKIMDNAQLWDVEFPMN